MPSSKPSTSGRWSGPERMHWVASAQLSRKPPSRLRAAGPSTRTWVSRQWPGSSQLPVPEPGHPGPGVLEPVDQGAVHLGRAHGVEQDVDLEPGLGPLGQASLLAVAV
jgi:hypothetical protein